MDMKEKNGKVESVYVDFDLVWAHVCGNGRHCYEAVERDEIPDNVELEDGAQEILRERNFSLATLPHIETATKAMRHLWESVMESESCMYYVEDDEAPWEYLDMTKEEFVEQVDSDVEKFGLQDVVCKDYEDSLYYCYGGLMGAFSGPLVACA